LLALFTRCFLVQAFRIPTVSMEPGLRVGDHMLVNKFVFAPARWEWERRLLPLRDPRRGDVVVFRFPRDPQRDFVKRVVAQPGDEVAMLGKRLSVDGVLPAESGYVRHSDARTYPDSLVLGPFARRDNLAPFRVPPETVFVLGDNRDRSEDSRFWGPVPRRYVRGRALLVYWASRADSGPVDASDSGAATGAPAGAEGALGGAGAPRLVR
jgi:signal peptidase I